MEYFVGGFVLLVLLLIFDTPIQDDPVDQLRMKYWDGQI